MQRMASTNDATDHAGPDGTVGRDGTTTVWGPSGERRLGQKRDKQKGESSREFFLKILAILDYIYMVFARI